MQTNYEDMKQYKAILIDWDDTIGDFVGAANTALHEMFEKYRLSKYFDSYEEFDTLYHEHNLELWKLYGEDKVTKAFLRVDRFLYPLLHGSKSFPSGENLEEALSSLAEKMSEDFLHLTTKYFSLLPGAEELVRYLAKKYPLTVVTNGFIEVQYEKFDKSGLRDCFSHIVLSEEVGCQKPNPRIYEEALRMNGVVAEEAIMIGDSWNSDIQGAINAGIDQIWIRKTDASLPEGQSATYFVKTLSEIMDIL